MPSRRVFVVCTCTYVCTLEVEVGRVTLVDGIVTLLRGGRCRVCGSSLEPVLAETNKKSDGLKVRNTTICICIY